LNSPTHAPEEKTRICWIIPTLDQGGAEKQLCLLAKGIDREKFEPLVITLTRSGPRIDELREANCPTIHIDKRGKLDFHAYSRLVQAIATFKPHVVHTWLFAANAYGRYAAIRAKVPLIFGGERCVDPWKKTYHHWIDRYLTKRTTGIITNSSAITDFYVAHGHDRSKFHVIHNGITARKPARFTREEVAKKLGLDPNRRWIGAIGRLWTQKNYKDMIWAAEMLRVRYDNTTFLIFGDGPERQRLEHYCDQVRASQQVKFFGQRQDVQDYLPHFSLFWNASLYEGQSNSILEAMQAGVPVIASNIGGNRDLVTHEKTGLLFPVGDVGELMKTSARLLDTPELRQSLSIAAKTTIETSFSVEQMVKKHERLYSRQ
jgi:glycosyltransferase involved in cell wall biosynthesis